MLLLVIRLIKLGIILKVFLCLTVVDTVTASIAPIKEICLKQCTEPWMCNAILEGIRERDKSLYNFKKQNCRKFKNFLSFNK